MTISLHIVVDNCPPEQLERALLYLQRVKPGTVDIAAGAELLKGMQFAERARRDIPGIKVFWRNLDPEDTGIHTKQTAQQVYSRKVAPYLEWFKTNEIVFMPDNESSGDDEAIKRYVKWQVEMAVLLHAVNLRGAFCRFSTGTIVESQYQLLKPLFNAMLPGDYVSPNEYSPSPNYKPGGGGHLRRYHEMWIAAGRELPTVIGEAGVAMDYNPGKGYIDAGMSDEAYAQQLLDEEIWYENGKIDRHVYLIGGFTHAGYRLREGVLDYWEKHYVKQAPVVIPPAPPAPADNWASAIAIVDSGGVNIRFQADANSKILAVIKNGDIIQYNRSGAVNGWIRVKKGNLSGYAFDRYLEITTGELPATNPDPTPIPLPPSPSQSEMDLKRVIDCYDAIHLKQAEIMALEAEIDTLLDKYRPLAKIA